MATLILTSFLVALLTVPLAFYLLWRSRKEEGEAGLPPGPRGLPLLGYLPFLGPSLHHCFDELARTHGPVMRLRLGARLCVVLSSPAAAQEALKDHDAVFADHDLPAVVFASVFERNALLFAPDGPQYRTLRKVCVRELLSPATIRGLYALRRREVAWMLEEVGRRAGEPVKVRELVSATAMKVMTMMMCGDTVAGEGDPLLMEFREAAAGMEPLLGARNVSDFFPALVWLDLQGIGRRTRRQTAWLNRIFDSIIEQRLRTAEGGGGGEAEEAKKGRDLLQVMLELLRKGDDPQAPLAVMQVKNLLLELAAAGTDTTKNMVERAMAELLCNPQEMGKAKEEISAVVGKDGTVEESHLPKLHYLDAVLKEVLRLHPVHPLLFPYCPSSTCTISGYRIPEGAKVFINAWAIHRDPQYWENASKFEPERFLRGGGRRIDYTGNNFHYLPFGAGRRICPGVLLGEMMVKFILASLRHKVDWTLPDGVKLDASQIAVKKETLVAVPTAQVALRSLRTALNIPP